MVTSGQGTHGGCGHNPLTDVSLTQVLQTPDPHRSPWGRGDKNLISPWLCLPLGNVSSTHGVEIPHPNPSPWGGGAKTLILRLLPLAQFGRGGWGTRAIELPLVREREPGGEGDRTPVNLWEGVLSRNLELN